MTGYRSDSPKFISVCVHPNLVKQTVTVHQHTFCLDLSYAHPFCITGLIKCTTSFRQAISLPFSVYKYLHNDRSFVPARGNNGSSKRTCRPNFSKGSLLQYFP